MAEQGEATIKVVYTDIETDEGAKYLGERRLTKIGSLATDRLGESLAELCKQVDRMLARVEESAGQYELSGFELTVEVTASGEIRLIGSASAEVKGGLTLQFSRAAHRT